MPTACVIDLGSNSIKSLVARAAAPGAGIVWLGGHTLEVRISGGLGKSEHPQLAPAAMESAMGAVAELLARAREHGIDRVKIVATSAVRDAANGPEFAQRLRAAVGHPLDILGGEEEARLIGLGLLQDPTLPAGIDTFSLFDLGGGSLEWIQFAQRQAQRRASFPLGAVRLTERFVPRPAEPLTPEIVQAIRQHVRATLAQGQVAARPPIIATGGAVVVAREILHRAGEPTESLTRAALERLGQRLGGLTLAERTRIPGLPPKRADILPTALHTLVEALEHAGAESLRPSTYNLRYGLAAELLQA